MGWHFRVDERLASILVPSGRDAKAGNSQVLERIGIGQPGSDCQDDQVLEGWALIVLLRRLEMTKS